MTDVPCDALLSDCEHQYVDQAVAIILSRGQLTEYLYASKSLALILFAGQLLNDYTLTNRIGPYEWWAYTSLLLTLSGLFEFLSFLAYKIWPSPTQYSLFFNTTAITASFPALIDWLLIYAINQSYDTMNFNKELDTNFTKNYRNFITMSLVDMLVTFGTTRQFLNKTWELKYR